MGEASEGRREMWRVEDAMRASERVQGKTEYEEYSIPMALLQLQVFLEKKLLVVCELNYEGAVEHFLKPLGEVEGYHVSEVQRLATWTATSVEVKLGPLFVEIEDEVQVSMREKYTSPKEAMGLVSC